MSQFERIEIHNVILLNGGEEGPVMCPKCGSTDVEVEGVTEGKNQRTIDYKCNSCAHLFDITKSSSDTDE